MSDYRDDRRSGRSGSDRGVRTTGGSSGSRSGQDRAPARPGARGAGKSYSELRYAAGRGDGRGSRNRDRERTDRGPDRGTDRLEPERPGTKGDGDKIKDGSEKGPDSSPAKLKDIPTSQAVSAADLEAQWQQEEEEKRKAEEKQREEEEKAKREEEERIRKKEEDEKRKVEEEKKSIVDYIHEVDERNNEKLALREKNLAAADNRPEDKFFSKLDSSLKKNTAFVKKLKLLSDSQKDSLTKDFSGLNLTKYIGEAAAAITEAKLKMSDISCAVHVCSILHQRYSEFAPNLMENWQKYLLTKKDDKIPNPSKYRVDLRFFGELVAVGVFKEREGLPLLANQLGYLINNDKEEHNNLSILTSFCKHCGDDYAGLVPRKYRKLAEKFELEVPKSKVLMPERQRGCRNLLGDYYTSLCKHLCTDHKELKQMEKQNRKTILTKGELSTEKKEKYEEAYNNYQKLLSNTATFCDLLDEDMPDLPEEEIKQDDEGGLDIFNPMKNIEFQYEGDSTLFEDEETRTFYESLPDLKASIPGILYKESEGNTGKDESKDETGLEEDMSNLEIEDVEREMETEKQLAEAENQEKGDKQEEHKDEMELPPIVEDEDDTGSIMRAQFDVFSTSLPTCVNRDLIDKAAIEFCMNFNTKTNRKKLVRALFTVHRTRYDLLPFYSRLVATLYPCMPEVANDLVTLLKGDFRWHVRKKDQINIESKLKTVRYIGELVKFKLYPKSEALHCVKMLLFDFSHHNIEMACALLETCGRFLYRSNDSHHRTRVYLEVMMRKKSALLMESRYATMIENAFYYSNPPEVQQVTQKVRPPMQEYIRKQLYKDLSKVTTEKVLRQMRKLNWDDGEISFYATKCLIAVWNVRFNSIHCAANLLAGIAPYHEHVAIQVVDGVLEDIRLGMEVNHPRYNQRRVSCVKYLGELYNYRMVESAVVFKTLYSFITFGVTGPDGIPSPLDPPEHLFRIRLVCVVLDTCGQYFDKGSSKKKLDCFLVYFQRYYWFKKSSAIWTENSPFPIDVDNMMRDTMESVRPKLKMLQSFEEACKACEELENEYKPKIASVLPILETSDVDMSETEDGSLAVIAEAEEISDTSQSLSQSHVTEEGEESEHSQDDTPGQTQNSQPGEERSENERDDEDDDDDDGYEATDDDDDDLDEDEVLIMKSGPKHIQCTEDEDFMAAFDKMLDDNAKARNSESLKVPQLDIAVPVNLKGQKTKKFELNPEPKEDAIITFTLMTKKGNKPQFTDLNVPITAEFATKYKEREQQEKLEKEKMKQVVLGIHERQEEEDYQEMIASLSQPAMVNNNRERRTRYQHPKGAPDADAIFGSKKR